MFGEVIQNHTLIVWHSLAVEYWDKTYRPFPLVLPCASSLLQLYTYYIYMNKRRIQIYNTYSLLSL